MIKLFLPFLFIIQAANVFSAEFDGAKLVYPDQTKQKAYALFAQGLSEENIGDYASALDMYSQVIKLDPGQLFVYKQAAKAALISGDMNKAGEYTGYLIAKDSSSAENWISYGNSKWAAGEGAAAEDAFGKALKLEPENTEAMFQLAVLIAPKDQDRALDLLDRYLKLVPDDVAEVYYQMAQVYSYHKDDVRTEEYLLKSSRANSFYLQPLYMLGDFYEEKGEKKKALEQYLKLLPYDSAKPELLDRIGELYSSDEINDQKLSEEFFLKAKKLDPKNAMASFWLSSFCEDRHDYACAAAQIENSELMDTDPGSIMRLAYFYTQLGDNAKAVGVLEAANKKWPDNKDLVYYLALGYDDLGKLAEARDKLKQIIDSDPDYKDSRLQYATLCERLDDMREAEKYFRQLIEKEPDNASYLNYLGYSLADRGMKLDDAYGMISKALSVSPDNYAYVDSMAWVLFKQGKTKEAEVYIKKAVGGMYKDETVWSHCADILYANGSYNQAWRAYRNSLLLDKAEKRKGYLKKIKVLEKDMQAATLAELRERYLNDFSPENINFSAFSKIEMKIRNRTLNFDAIISYGAPDKIKVSLLGPMSVPVWTGSIDGKVSDIPKMTLKDLDTKYFDGWASAILNELLSYFNGTYYKNISFKKAKDLCYRRGKGEVCLGAESSFPVKIVSPSDPQMKVKFGGYHIKNMYVFPNVVEFAVPGVNIKCTIDTGTMNISGENRLAYPVRPGAVKNQGTAK